MSEKPRLSFYTNIPAPYQLAFFSALSQKFTLTVIYYATRQNGNEWPLDPQGSYKTVVLKNNFIATILQKVIPDFHFSWGIFRVLGNDPSELVIVGGGYAIPNSIVALLGSKLKGKKVAYFSEALLPAKSQLKFRVKKGLLQILNLCCDVIFCTGKKAVRTFEDFGVKPAKHVIPYNINTAIFEKENLNPEKINAFYQTYKSNKEFVILSSGFLIPRKGMDILIRAFLGLRANAKLVILGSGEQETELKALCGKDGRVVFAGFQRAEDIPYFFNLADLFVLASRYDGWGVVINEAIAANVPVVSSDQVGAAVELITPGENGVICESENVEAFRMALENLIQDELLLNKIKTNSRKLVPLVSSEANAGLVYQVFLKLAV